MNSVDLAFTPALDQATLIRQKTVSPVELVELYLSRIQSIDPQVNSYLTILADRALKEAAEKTEAIAKTANPDELPPFFGVPISVKDLNPMNGVRFTLGTAALTDNVATFDDATVMRIQQAGFIILGKTATPELGTLPYTEPHGLPPARNPWNLDYTPGGSSGGAAASLAAGLCAIAQGSDGGGSIRGPAFCCGLVGIKPARGRISYAPIGDTPGGIATNGPLARTVADAAAFIDAIAGYVPGDPYWLPAPQPSFLATARQAAQQGVGRSLRIGYLTAVQPLDEAESSCKQAVLDTVQHLETLGHQVEPTALDISALIEPFTVVFRAGIGAAGIPPEALSPMNQWFFSHQDSAGGYFKALWQMQAIARRLIGHLSQFDAVVLPTYLHPPIRVGEWADLSPAETLDEITRWIAPCPPFNATGQPVVALPTGFGSNGLPIGVQIVGRPADEATIIAVAAQLEAINPWRHRPPLAKEG
ncbi:MAG: amidase [Synechococcales bacterium]|nr:amidase [Synechococcales bacterium]